MEENKKIRLLVIVDAQRDFIYGALANEAAQKVIPNIVKKIKEFDGDGIILTMDTHFDDYLDTPEGKKLPVKHCIYGTDGWKLNPEVQHAVEDKELLGMSVYYIMKPTFGSVVGVTPTGEETIGDSIVDVVLRHESGIPEPIPMEIEICGFVSSICVVSNALILKAFTYDFAEITFDAECSAGLSDENHKAAIEVMKSCQINVINEKKD